VDKVDIYILPDVLKALQFEKVIFEWLVQIKLNLLNTDSIISG
jgi:hypothetical protein